MMDDGYNLKKINSIKDVLLQRDQTLAVAESVTAGQLQVAFSLADNATQFFQGGITVYNLGQKARHLHIEPIQAENDNCVSEKVSLQMAVRVCEMFSSDWGIAITGYASPVPELGIEKLYACYAICFRGECIVNDTVSTRQGHPLSVRTFFTNHVLDQLYNICIQQEV